MLDRDASRRRALSSMRFVELIDLFDRLGRGAKVCEIHKALGWPQSSTTNLLETLVRSGLLYRDDRSRSYAPTPRVAMLGANFQPDFIKDGRLSQLMSRLQNRTKLGVALFGQTALEAQVQFCTPAAGFGAGVLRAGALCPVTDGVAGWLLLSRAEPKHASALTRAIRARPHQPPVTDGALRAHIESAVTQGYLCGPLGFGSRWRMCGTLTPPGAFGQPLVVGVLYPPGAQPSEAELGPMLKRSVERYLVRDHPQPAEAPEAPGATTPRNAASEPTRRRYAGAAVLPPPSSRHTAKRRAHGARGAELQS